MQIGTSCGLRAHSCEKDTGYKYADESFTHVNSLAPSLISSHSIYCQSRLVALGVSHLKCDNTF